MWGLAIIPLSVLLVLVVVAAFWAVCTLNYSYIYIVMIILQLRCVVIIPSRLLSVSPVCIDLVGSHAPHQLVLELGRFLPPPPGPLCSEGLSIAL